MRGAASRGRAGARAMAPRRRRRPGRRAGMRGDRAARARAPGERLGRGVPRAPAPRNARMTPWLRRMLEEPRARGLPVDGTAFTIAHREILRTKPQTRRVFER